MVTLKILIEGLSLILAIVALLLARKEYNSHKMTEYNKLFSQLNRRYEKNENMQTVVKYLRDKEPSNDIPSLYQFEVFLRFFEELGLYMKAGSLNSDDVDDFFGYYLRQLYTTPRGEKLLSLLGDEEKQLELLQTVKNKLNIH
jgi:hypothetical protein